MKKYLLLFTLAIVVCAALQAQDCLYPELDGKKGEEIRNVLFNKIKDHKVLSYNSVWASVTGADDRNDGSGTIWDMYSDCVFDKWDDKCGSGESEDDCECYNREHSLPKSWWGGDTDVPMYTDLHHLIPTDRLANSQRSAWPLGEVSSVEWTNGSSKLGYGTFGSSGNNMTFEPADEYKGDFARIYFYMATCYKDQDFTAGGKGYKVFINGTANFLNTALNLYLKWHRNDPVSDKEIRRNNAVAKKQGNRNPFVDEPELAEYIWGNKKSVAYSCGTGSAVEDVNAGEAVRVKKVIEGGHLYIILPDGTRYTATGMLAK